MDSIYISGEAQEVHRKLVNLAANIQGVLATILANEGKINVNVSTEGASVANQPDYRGLPVSVEF
jgi:hypothetical protein